MRRRFILRIAESLFIIGGIAPCAAPAMRPSSVGAELADRRIGLEVEEFDFEQICHFLRVPCGIQFAKGDDFFVSPGEAENSNAPLFQIVAGSSIPITIRDLLDRGTAGTRYRWVIEDGVVNILPRAGAAYMENGKDILDRKIKEIEINGMASESAAQKLLRENGIRNYYQIMGKDYSGPPICWKRIKLHLRGITIRQALNRIVQADGKAMWRACYVSSGGQGQGYAIDVQPWRYATIGECGNPYQMVIP